MTPLSIGIAVVLLLGIYLLVGWALAIVFTPRAWRRARVIHNWDNDYSTKRAVRDHVRLSFLCTLFFWPLFVPGIMIWQLNHKLHERDFRGSLDTFLARRDPEQLQPRTEPEPEPWTSNESSPTPLLNTRDGAIQRLVMHSKIRRHSGKGSQSIYRK